MARKVGSLFVLIGVGIILKDPSSKDPGPEGPDLSYP